MGLAVMVGLSGFLMVGGADGRAVGIPDGGWG